MLILVNIFVLCTYLRAISALSSPNLRKVELSLSPYSSFKILHHRVGSESTTHLRRERILRPIRLAASTMGEAKNDGALQHPKGLFNAVGLSSKPFVSGIATIVLYFTDSWIPLYYILAAVVNGMISKTLKIIIRQPRPSKSGKEGYGMPSSHTQAFFFFFTVVTLNSSRFLGHQLSMALSLSLLCYSCLASYWRVVAGVHTFSQTLVGAVVGIIFGGLISRNEVSLIGLLGPMSKKTTGVPLLAKIFISSLGALVICKSEIKTLVKFMLKRN